MRRMGRKCKTCGFPMKGKIDPDHTDLMDAAFNGHADCVLKLINAGADVNEENENGDVALRFAIQGGDTDCISDLLMAGADFKKVPTFMWLKMATMECDGKLSRKKDCSSTRFAVALAKTLIEEGYSMDSILETGTTDLMRAARKGDEKTVRKLLKSGAKVNAHRSENVTALHEAAMNGHFKCVDVLLKAGAGVNQESDNGMTSLMYVFQECLPNGTDASKNVRPDKCVQLLLRAGANVNATAHGEDDRTVLMFAAANEHDDCIPLLLKAGAKVNAVSKYGSTALIEAAGLGNPKCARQLLKAGADVNKVAKQGETAEPLTETELLEGIPEGVTALQISICQLHLWWKESHGGQVLSISLLIILSSYPECLVDLIKAGANLEIKDIKGCTPLMEAAKAGTFKCVEPLLKAGADINARNKKGDTVLICAMYEHEEDSELLKLSEKDFTEENHNREKCVRLLLKAGADVNATDDDGETALEYAISNEHVASIPLLIKAGADVNATDAEGTPALFKLFSHQVAHHERWEEACMLLIKSGAVVNTADSYGNTALMCAVGSGCYFCVSKVLKAKIKVDAANSDGYTALLFAAESGECVCLDMLLSAGADVNHADMLGNTALHHAASANKVNSIRLLIQEGADVNITNFYGQNPLQYAITSNTTGLKEKVAKLLYAAGAKLGGTYVQVPCSIMSVRVPEYLLQADAKMNLKSMCKETIRKRLLEVNPHKPLFSTVSKLGLPALETEYLLSNVSLEEEDDDSDDSDSSDDDDDDDEDDDWTTDDDDDDDDWVTDDDNKDVCRTQ